MWTVTIVMNGMKRGTVLFLVVVAASIHSTISSSGTIITSLQSVKRIYLLFIAVQKHKVDGLNTKQKSLREGGEISKTWFSRPGSQDLVLKTWFSRPGQWSADAKNFRQFPEMK